MYLLAVSNTIYHSDTATQCVYCRFAIFMYKPIPLQDWAGLVGSRSLRLTDLKKIGA